MRLLLLAWIRVITSLRKGVKKSVNPIFAHLLYFGGLAAISYGCWLYSHGLGFIVGGLVSAWTAFLVSADG